MASPFDPIPNNYTPMDAFAKGAATSQNMMDSMMRSRLNPYQVQLLAAQARQAQSEAMQSDILNQIFKRAAGIGQPDNQNMQPQGMGSLPPGTMPPTGAISATGEQVLPNNVNGFNNQNASPSVGTGTTPNVNPQDAQRNFGNLLLASKLGLPREPINVEGKVGYRDPITGEAVYTQVGQTPPQKATTEAKGKATEEALKDLTTDTKTALSLNDDIQGLKGVMENPRYANIAGTTEGYAMNAKPLGLPLGAMLKNFYPKEDQDLLGTANAHMGNIVTKFGQLFKGPYKDSVNNLVSQMKPNINDPLAIQTGKMKALETLYQVGQQRRDLMESYISQGMNPAHAMLLADKQLPYNKIRDQVISSSGIYKSANGVPVSMEMQTNAQNPLLSKNSAPPINASNQVSSKVVHNKIASDAKDFQSIPIHMYNPKTGNHYDIPQGKVQKAIDAGYQRMG